MRSQIEIECISDICFSKPMSDRADIDIAYSTDRYGLPTLPGKTLHGLLRDAWLTLQPMFDVDRSIGHALLGKPGNHAAVGVLRIGTAHVSLAIRDAVRTRANDPNNALDPTAVRDAFGVTRVFTREDRLTAAPSTDTLRTLLAVAANTRLFAPISTSRDLTDEELDLLMLILSVTRHAGLARNRGLGHIRLSLDASVSATVPESKRATNHVPETTATWHFLPYKLTLTAPAIFRRHNTDANSCSTHDYIPGSSVRGALAAHIERCAAAGSADASTLFEQLIVNERARFLNCYPAAEELCGYPTPITWQRDKDAILEDWQADPVDVVPVLACDVSDSDTCSAPGPLHQREAVKAGFVAKFGREYAPVDPHISFTTHQTRDRVQGATRKGETTVFVYESIDEGQEFHGSIALEEKYVSPVREFLKQADLWLGRSARAGYGGAPDIAPLDDRCTEALDSPDDVNEDALFKVTLTSSALVRNRETLQHDPWALEEYVCQRFEGAGDLVGSCVKSDMSRGYNRLWRTELPQLPCACAGSVVLMRARRFISGNELAERIADAIGERSADGYGCVRVERCNASTLGEPEVVTLRKGRDGASADLSKGDTIPDGASLKEIELAQRRLYRTRLRPMLAAGAVREIPDKLPAGVSSSLFQRLRRPLRAMRAVDGTNTAELQSWQASYSMWLTTDGSTSEGANKRLRRELIEALERVRVGADSVAGILRKAAGPNWMPPETLDESNMKEQCRLTRAESADRIWLEERVRLRMFYLDTLLGALARKAKGGRA